MSQPAHIYITSYLGDTQELRARRLQMHIEQREQLSVLFPDLRIISLCSQYSTKERKSLGAFDSINYRKRYYKHQLHNEVFDDLYQHQNRACLLLDDDVLPKMEEKLVVEG